jgi:hypothetical protein
VQALDPEFISQNGREELEYTLHKEIIQVLGDGYTHNFEFLIAQLIPELKHHIVTHQYVQILCQIKYQ